MDTSRTADHRATVGVTVDSRRIVRHLYRRYGGERYSRSVAELTQDLAAMEREPEIDACEVAPAVDRAAPIA